MGIESADRGQMRALGPQTEVFGCIGYGERGLPGHLVCRQSLRGHRVCRQRSAVASGLKTEDCGGIGSADRGLRVYGSAD